MEPTDEQHPLGVHLPAPPTVAPNTVRRLTRRPELCVAAADVVVVIGSFLPWVISGSARRDSYATVRVAKNVGVVGMAFWEAVLSIWFVMPLLAALALVGVLLRRRRLALAAAIPLGVIALVVAAVVRGAPVEHGWGPSVTLVGAVGLLAGSTWMVLASRRQRAREREPRAVPGG